MYYSNTASYWLKFYFNNKDINVDEINKIKAKHNWNVCKVIVDKLNKEDQTFLKEFYTSDESKNEIINRFTYFTNDKENTLWKKVKDVEKEYAEIKGI